MKLPGTLAAMACALQLAACNLVVSDEPMLVRDTEAPIMKPGIWVDAAGDEPCDYDTATSPESWPKCADPAIVLENGDFMLFGERDRSWRRIEIVLAEGDPTVVQVKFPEEFPGRTNEAPGYIFMALRPTAFDDDGTFTEMQAWIVLCGPPNDAQSTDIEDAVTKAPFDGLTISEGNCIPDSVEAIRNAAEQSIALSDKVGRARWVRAADDVEFD